MKLIITGYYDKQNYGDDLFKEIASKIFNTTVDINIYIVTINKLLNNDELLTCDRLVLFGGETLNDYFLNILIKFKLKIDKLNTDFKMCAVGVSCNQDYTTIINKIQLFNHIVFRSKKDYSFFKKYIDCVYCPDIVMTLLPTKKMKKSIIPLCNKNKNKNNKNNINNINNINKKNFGFFLSQTCIYNKSKEFIIDYINTIVLFIEFLIERNYSIALFSMCVNNIESESDLIINSMIMDKLTDKQKEVVIFYTSTDDILKNIAYMSYTLCWRYHAHILSIIHNKPFISISQTPKVKALLEDNDLNRLFVDINNSSTDSNIDNLIQMYYKIINNKRIIKQKIGEIYKKNNKLSTKLYYDHSIYLKERSETIFYLCDNDITKLYNYIINTYLIYLDSHIAMTAKDKTMIILFLLMRSIKNDYTFGLCEKIEEHSSSVSVSATAAASVTFLKEDILWLINDCIFKKNMMFYITASTVLSKTINNNNNNNNNNNTCKYNFKYMDQDNYKGLHRSGWSYIVDHLYKINNSMDEALLCDLYLDRTFHWNNNEYATLHIIPYTKSWVGFIHHTCEIDYSDYNTTYLFKNENFIKSLQHCKGLFVLSNYLKTCVETLLVENSFVDVKVVSLVHPTEFTEKCFKMKYFIKNGSKKVIQIGSWLRNLDAINNLLPSDKDKHINIQKCVLKCKNMEDIYYYNNNNNNNNNNIKTATICRDQKDRRIVLKNDIIILDNLNNDEYDTLLTENIVFINLISASAVNTIIECIVRNTPILVNRLPASIELLGETYPLFYDDIKDASLLLTINKITEGYKYLKNLDKTKFKIETFVSNFLSSLNI